MKNRGERDVADLYIRSPLADDEWSDIIAKNQLKELREFCIQENLEVDRIIFDRGSAINFERSEWKKYLHDMLSKPRREKKNRFLIYTSPDRFSRQAHEAVEMIDYLKTLGITAKSIIESETMEFFQVVLNVEQRGRRQEIEKN